ncbi:RagB/SusD family nutrient uptake outer membrane protein [Polluticaenibacter yanchengensis]|uniref:RagB/SusD family nutrient uptake outer membrane protein n=1 Tax=Polluticaenibacter yanchengensis TaxID=3014562 RepID=A0ABT4UL77_9BACT|nr:RagB/SusD family nutrient uptake outer membrane protein [Chitinophagaceae bacterium LY-5]
MKLLKNIVLASTLILTVSSCSKDYLDTKPTNSTSTETAFESTTNAKMVINGLAKLMTRQYLGSQGFNGEGTIKMYYGNYPGENFFVNLSGWSNIINGEFYESFNSIYDYYPWYYYYMIVSNANAVIARIDAATGPDTEKKFIKAQALTYRAYCFFMLSQLYANRWADSNNGAGKGILLRTDLSTGDMALSTLAETYKQVYDDLDLAIKLYGESGLKRANNYSMDINVAYAVYARAAITKQDWALAESYAVKAREGYPLMNNTDYKSGFNRPTSEWIWSSYGAEDETLYFYSYHAYIAYNSTASAVRTYPKCISKTLYDKIPATDIRKGMFLNPAGYTYTASTGVAGTALTAKARTDYPALQSNATAYAYMNFKISNIAQAGVGHLNHFRSSEMYLIEAEAKHMQNKPAEEVQNVLLQLIRTSGRDASYTVNKTGAALLQEIKTYRGIELWGEGFDWFDKKRWNEPIERLAFDKGGNFISSLAVTIQPSQKNKWTWVVPAKETDFNTLSK